jgi:RNA polymerase sigma factor (sigma-70 family)
MTQSRETLVERARVGDERAWEALVAQYRGLLWAVARDFRLNQEQAADAAQTTWMLLVQNIRNIRDPEKVGGWLSSTMRRECIRLVNRQRGEQLTHDWSDEPDGHAVGPDVDVLLAERNALLWSAVERLPPRQRQVLFALAADPPPSYEEIGVALSMAVGTIGPTRQSALQRLRRFLVETGVVENPSGTSTGDHHPPFEGRAHLYPVRGSSEAPLDTTAGGRTTTPRHAVRRPGPPRHRAWRSESPRSRGDSGS